MILTTDHNLPRLIWGVMAITLAVGDSFHLIPRIMAAATGEAERFRKAMGIGKMLTSITMTIFYGLLWYIGLILFSKSFIVLTMLLWVFAIIRIALCLLPKNKWVSATPSYKWGIYRNIPFLMMGLMVFALYACYAMPLFPQLRFMWLAVALSFGFYIPVVLGAGKHPKLGMLMLPKTLAYVWIMCMGLGL